MEAADFEATLRDRLAQSGVTPIGAAVRAGLPRDAIRSVLRGHPPNIVRAAEICDALDLEFYVGPPRGDPGLSAEALAREGWPLDRFDPAMDMPARGYAKCSLVGHLEKESEYRELPAPEGAREIDADAFYVVARGPSMVPEGIEGGDYCLVSPNTPLAAGMRVWLKDRQGKACIKRLIAISDKSYSLRGWQDPAGGRQRNYDDEWMKKNVAEKGVVLAVYRGKPDAADPPPLIPDPKPPPAPAAAPREIAELFDLPPGASVADAVKAIEERLRDAVGLDAAALRAEMADVVKAESETVRAEIAATREAITTLADASALAPLSEDGEPPGARPVDIVELAAAAGGGSQTLDEEVTGRLWFRRDWLDGHGLDPTRCAVIGVMGESMEPLLWPGARILVDRAQRRWRRGEVFVLRTDDGLIVKRAGENEAGVRLLVSDHPDHPPIPFSDDAEIIGRVVWTARTLA